VLTNCSDFWCDPAPILKGNTSGSGEALLGGIGVDYYRMYETPLRMRGNSGSGDRSGRYQRLAEEEEVLS
jgi:palmitoyltransferase